MSTLNQEIGCRESSSSGFTLFSDDPIEKDLEHYIDPQAKVISSLMSFVNLWVFIYVYIEHYLLSTAHL